MICPKCSCVHIKKNGMVNRVQRFKCNNCKRLFLEKYSDNKLTEEYKSKILKGHLEGLSLRALARQIGKCSWFAIRTFLKRSNQASVQFP